MDPARILLFINRMLGLWRTNLTSSSSVVYDLALVWLRPKNKEYAISVADDSAQNLDLKENWSNKILNSRPVQWVRGHQIRFRAKTSSKIANPRIWSPFSPMKTIISSKDFFFLILSLDL